MDLSLFTNRIINEAIIKTPIPDAVEFLKRISGYGFSSLSGTFDVINISRENIDKNGDKKLSKDEVKEIIHLLKRKGIDNRSIETAVYTLLLGIQYSDFITKGKKIRDDLQIYNTIVKKSAEVKNNPQSPLKEYVDAVQEALKNGILINKSKDGTNNIQFNAENNKKVQNFNNNLPEVCGGWDIKDLAEVDENIIGRINIKDLMDSVKLSPKEEEEAEKAAGTKETTSEAHQNVKMAKTAYDIIKNNFKNSNSDDNSSDDGNDTPNSSNGNPDISNGSSNDKFRQKVENRMLGKEYSEGSYKSRIFGVAIPSLSAASGNREDPGIGFDNFNRKFKDAFVEKVNAVLKQLTDNLDIVDKNESEKANEGKINLGEEIFDKVITERFSDVFKRIGRGWSHEKESWGALIGNSKSTRNYITRNATELKKKIVGVDEKGEVVSNSELDKLGDEVEELVNKYHNTDGATKRISIMFELRKKYIDFIRKAEESFTEFKKLADLYIESSSKQAEKAGKKIKERNYKNNPIGEKGQDKAADLEAAKQRLIENLDGKKTMNKVAAILLYGVVANGGETNVNELMKALDRGTPGLKVCVPKITDPEDVSNINGCSKVVHASKVKEYTSPILALSELIGSNDKTRFIFNNPEIFKFIRSNESFSEFYEKFKAGMEKAKVQTATSSVITEAGQSNDNSLPAGTTSNTPNPQASTDKNKPSFEQSLKTTTAYIIKDFKAPEDAENLSLEELGLYSKLLTSKLGPNIAIGFGDNITAAISEDDWKKLNNPQVVAAAKEEANIAAKNPGIFDKTKEILSNAGTGILNKIEEAKKSKNLAALVKIIKDEIETLKYTPGTIKNGLNKLGEKASSGLNNLSKKAKQLDNNLSDFSNKKVNSDLLSGKEQNIAKAEKNGRVDYSNWHSAVETEDNNQKVQQLEALLKEIETTKKQQSTQQTNTQAQQPNTQPNQPVNSTVTTSAADATYGNGYAKGRKIREIIYKKGDYTVKTREEL